MTDIQTIIMLFDLCVTTLWTIALVAAAFALWNAAREFKQAQLHVVKIVIEQKKPIMGSPSKGPDFIALADLPKCRVEPWRCIDMDG